MKAIGNRIGVVFDDNHLKEYDLGNGIKLERALEWRAREDDGETMTKTQSNVNHLHTNPQIGHVVMANDKYDFEVGDKIFMHYLAFEEFEENIEVDGKECYLIEESFVLFKFKDNDYVMRQNVYLGSVVIEEPPKTTSGIFLTSQEAVKNELRISITNVPVPSVNEYGVLVKNVCEVGDVIVPIDKSNYHLMVEDKEYVMLRGTEIVGSYGVQS